MEDKDFIDFKFNGHWASEFNLIAVSSGDRYTSPFYGEFSPNVSTLMGKTGIHKWKTQIGEKSFEIKIAYDNVNLSTLRKIKEWLNPFVIAQLEFKETPYKYYWASLAEEPHIEFLPFKIEEKVIDGQKFKQGVFKGELNLKFICVDNCGYGNKGTFMDSNLYVLDGSNLLKANDEFYNNNNIKTESFNEIETGNPDSSGISKSRAIYLYNAGDQNANLTLKFDYIPPQTDSPIDIVIDKVKLTNNGWQTVQSNFSEIRIESFENYKPFLDLLKKCYNIDDLSKLPENWNEDWEIDVNSDLKEIYLVNKENDELIISLNKFNSLQSFLKLSSSNFVDYSKAFPTLLTEISNSAIADTYFNKIYLKDSIQNYRLKNIKLEWKHTYL